MNYKYNLFGLYNLTNELFENLIVQVQRIFIFGLMFPTCKNASS